MATDSRQLFYLEGVSLNRTCALLGMRFFAIEQRSCSLADEPKHYGCTCDLVNV
jgi:hypothetical protein